MAGLGTLFILMMALATLLDWRGALAASRPMLWVLMLAFPFPYIAKTAGWMTAELGRQPWLVYGLMRTVGRRQSDGALGHGAVHADRVLPGSTSCSACCSCS